MKDLINYTMTFLVKVALHLYYSKIHVVGRENIPKNKAVLIIANHQNALIDPILIATHLNLKPYFLTRASIFKNPIVAKLLDFIRMIPIFRVRDGIENMEKNQETFDLSTKILSSKKSILIFGEGNHSLKRNLRPLKKGFARIVVKTLEKDPDLDLVILPVGINYSNHKNSGSKVRLIIGKPFSPKDYCPNHGQLVQATHAALKPLVSHIPEANYQKDLERLIENGVDLTDPTSVEYFLSQEDLKHQIPEKVITKPYLANKVMKIFHFPIYWIWLAIARKVKDPAFTATFKFVIGLVAIPIWYFLLWTIFPEMWGTASAMTWGILGFVYLLANKTGQE
ncbi:lysophospholipid acyltransferase family protein [Rhodonellum sp.]|uniref:lysophospholipid acyltransferase family protein n=1 Tax=Rhodonellum sp. TaxID=2231180 RepID=UPI002716F9BA|nr:lysophospholipid acyltransferase family protein [Rhodonellum sp.]MDO9554675.1 lysophospholipid acyltransferase family protein [Rhodonellum sp.]